MSQLLSMHRLIGSGEPMRFDIHSELHEHDEGALPTAVATFGIVDLVIARRTGRVASAQWHHDAVDPQPARLPAIRPTGGALVAQPAVPDLSDGVIAHIEATVTYRDDRTGRTMVVRRDLERAGVDRYVTFADHTAAGLRGRSLVALWWSGATPSPARDRTTRPSSSPHQAIAGSSPRPG